MTNAPVDPRLVEFVRQRRQKATAQPVNPKLVDFVRQRRAAKNPPVNIVGMPVLPGDADYERVQHENRVYQNTKEYGDPFEGSPGMIAKRFGEVVATGGKGVLPAAYDSTIGATARGLGRVAASVAEGTGLASKERADQTRAVMDTYAQNEARTAAQTPGGSVGSFVGPAALSAGMMLATRTPYAGAVTGTGLGIYGLSSADQGMAEYRATRQQQGKEANPWEELAVGAGYGAAEILFERIGLNKTGAAIRSVGQNMADAVLRRDAKALAQIAMSTAESVGVNMTEEGATQYAQNIIDSTFDPNQDINEGVRSSMIGGGLQGLMFAGPGGAVSAAYHGGRMARGAAQTAGDVGRAVVADRMGNRPNRPTDSAPDLQADPQTSVDLDDAAAIAKRLDLLDYAIANPGKISVKVDGKDMSRDYAARDMAAKVAERDMLQRRLDEIAPRMQSPAPTPPTPPAPLSGVAAAAEARLRGRRAAQTDPTAQPPAPISVATESPRIGPLVPPGEAPSEQDLADARAIITRDPSIVTQPSRFRAEYLAARKRRAQPARPVAYTDNPDLATVLGADQLGLTNIRTRRENANAAQRYESGGSAPGAVAVRGPDVPAAPTPAVQDRAVPPADQGRGMAGAPDVAASPSPVGDGVGEVVGQAGAQTGDQPGDVGVTPKQPWEMTRGDYAKASKAPSGAVGVQLRGEVLDGARSAEEIEAIGSLPKDIGKVSPEQTTLLRKMQRDGLVTKKESRNGSRVTVTWEATDAGLKAREAQTLTEAQALVRYNEHGDLVARALSEGKPVPAEVLAEYPDLAAKAPAATAPQETGAAKPAYTDFMTGPGGKPFRVRDLLAMPDAERNRIVNEATADIANRIVKIQGEKPATLTNTQWESRNRRSRKATEVAALRANASEWMNLRARPDASASNSWDGTPAAAFVGKPFAGGTTDPAPKPAQAPAASSAPRETGDSPTVSFRGIPPASVRQRLKAAGFAFNKETRAWVGPQTDEARQLAVTVAAERDEYLANRGTTKAAPAPTTTAKTETQPAAPVVAKTPKNAANATKLRRVADSTRAKGEESLGRDRNANTPRRARMADSAVRDAQRLVSMADLATKVADEIEANPDSPLANIGSMVQLQELIDVTNAAKREAWKDVPESERDQYRDRDRLQRSDLLPVDNRVLNRVGEASLPWINGSNFRDFVEAVGKMKGAKQAAAKMARYKSYDGSAVRVDATLAGLILEWGSNLDSYTTRSSTDAAKEYFRRAAITGGDLDVGKLRDAVKRLAELRNQVPVAKENPVAKLERALVGQTVGIDFFPTPPAIAADLVDRADIRPGMRVLEPSAGNGRIADAIKAAGVEPDVVEVSSSLREILEAKGHNLVAQDFNDFNPGPVYDRVLMNPPFSERMDVEHVRRAFGMLKPGGRLVAIMSEGPFFGSDKKATAFREWLDENGGVSEKLPDGSFAKDRTGMPTTGVAARIVVVDKPAAKASPTPQPPSTPAPAQKQPWEMTKAEWNAKLTPTAAATFGSFQHRNFVLDALADGADVPPHVIAEYPGIVGQAERVRKQAAQADAITRANKDKMDAAEQARKNAADAAYQANVDRNIATLNQHDAYLRDEAWKKRKAEYVTYKRGGARQLQEGEHRESVARALSEGKPVPAEVLAEYPDLAAKAPAATAPRETGAADYAADIPERIAVAAHANTSHVPEKRGQQRRDEYAATLKSAREQLDAAAKTDEQKRIADAEFARYREGMKSRTLAYLNALSRTASSMITGPANFPVERNRKAGAVADKRGEELRDFDKRARAAMLRAVNAAATPEMRSNEETGRIEQITAKFIGRSRDGFNAMSKQNFVGKLERAAKNGETQAVARALQMLREEGQRRGKPLFVNRASIWKLADVATEAVQAEASAPTGEQEHATYTDGTRVVRNYDDDRLRILFPGKPSDAQRTTLKSRGFKWSPANGAWQRQNTQAAVLAADDILRGFGKERKESPTPPPTPTPSPAPAQKQPWEMTAQAYSDYEAGVMGESAKPVTDRFKSWHRSKVILATREGKPVPAEVLAEYPDLGGTTRTSINEKATDQGLAQTPNASLEPDQRDGGRDGGAENVPKFPGTIKATMPSREETVRVVQAFFRIRHEQRGKSSPFRKVDPSVVVSGDDSWTKYARGGESIILDWPNVHIPEDAADAWNRAVYASGVSDLRVSSSSQQTTKSPTPQPPSTPDPAQKQPQDSAGSLLPDGTRKQIWEMSREEFRDKAMRDARYAQAIGASGPVASIPRTEEEWEFVRKFAIGKALYDGKPVPAEVLAEYPDLVPNSPVSPDSSPAAPPSQAEAPAVNYADDIPINVAVGAFTNTSHTPEKRGQARREEYAATLKSAREELDKAAVTPEQKAIADAEFARYRDGMKRRMLDYLRAHSRVASAMITGPANFPTERNRKAGNAADNRLSELVDFDKRARAAMMKAVRGAATPEMMASEESARLEKRVQRFIDHAEDPKGGATSLFKSNLQGALERAAKNGETTAVANALRKLRDWQTSTGRTIFTNRSSIWKLADISEKAVEEAAAAPTGEQEVASYTDGTRIVRNFDDDRVRIFFPGKPSDAQRTTLKSRGFKWSPANGAWQRQNTANGYLTALDLMLGFGKQKNEAAAPQAAPVPTAEEAPTPQPPSTPDPATLPRPQLVRLAKERGVDTKGTKKQIAERVKAETSPDPAAKYQPRTRPWLSREAKRRGMNGNGSKADLIAMLVASDQQRATVQQGATDGGTDTTPVGQVAGADQRWPGVRQGNKARNGVGSKGSQRGKGEAFRGEYSKSDIQRRLTQAVESSGYPIDDIETESFRAEELGIPEFSTSFAGDNLPGEIRDWLEGRGIAYRSLFTTGSSKMRGTGEDSFAALGSDRYFEIVEQLYSKARNIDKAARSLAKSGGYPDVSFFLWLSDRLPERQAERGPFEIVEASTIGDGQVVKILGTYFEGVKDPKWGGIQIIERGDGGEVIDRRALVIEPTLTTRIPIDAGSLSTAEQEFGPRESGTDDAPPAKRSDERGVFGQQAEGITGAQIGMFSGTRDVKGEKQQTARWQEGDAFSIRNERFRVVRVEKDPQTPNNPGDDWITYEEVDRRGKGSGKYREISHNDLRRHWQVEPPTDRTADREAARRAMSDSEAQERYPGIRRGESVAKYEKRMGTTDTAAMFDAIADRAKERLEKRAKKQRGSKTLNAGLNPEQLGTALRDTVDLSIVGAAKAAAAGVRAGRALTKIVDAAIAEMGRTVTPKVRAIIQKNVRKILAESGGDPVKFEQVVKEMYEAPVTKREIKAAKDAAKGQGVAKAERTAAGRILAATRKGYKAGIRDERRTAIANMQGVVNDIKRERGRLRSLAQFEKRAGEVAVKMTADDARRAQMIRDGIRKQVVQYARTLPKEVRGKLVGRIATADTPTKMIQTVRELQRELMRHDGREAWGWIKKNARSSAVDKLKGVTNDLRKSVADLYAKAASAKRRIDAAETLKDSSIALAELQNLQAEIGLHITTARAAFKAIKGQRQQSAFQIATNAAQIIEARFAKRSGDGVSQIRDPKRWWVRKHLDSYNDLRNMLATLEGDNGPLFSAIWEALEEGSAEYSTLRRDKRAAMEQAYVRAGFKDMADAIDSLSAFAGRGVEKNYTVTVGGESKTLSLGEISSLIAHNSDPETAALIASEHGMRFKSTEGTGSDGVIPTPNEIKDMAAAIAKDYKLAQLVDDLKAIIEKDADSTLREVGELTGVQPKKVEKRWTRSREMEMVPGMEDKPITTADPSMVNVIRSFAENMGIYEHRTQTTGIPILLKDVHSVMEEEIHKQAATLALARRVRDAMLVLTQDQLGKAIINAKGVEFYRSLKRQVMAAGRTEVVYATQAEKAVGFLKGSAAVKYLAANPSTYIGNLLGTLRVLPDVDARYYAAGIAAMWSMSRAELEAKSGYLWDRWEQQGMGRFGPSHEATMDARLTQAHTGFRSFLREIGRQVRNSMKNAGRLDLGAGLTNLRLGSAAFMQGLNWVESRIAAFTWGAMDAKIRSEQPNLSDKARQKIVEKFVRREMRETQNGGDPVDAATIATQNRSSAASMVMFLLSDVMKVRNRVKRAFRQSKTYGSKVLAAEAVGALAKAYAVKYLWDSIAFGIAGALGDDDDKERITERMKEWTSPIERAAQELFQIVAPIGGPDLASLIDALRGRYSDRARGGPVAMLAPLNDARAAGWDAFSVIAKSIENDDMNAEKIGLALAKFFDETASAFGLNPLSPWTRRVLREIVQTRKSEWW